MKNYEVKNTEFFAIYYDSDGFLRLGFGFEGNNHRHNSSMKAQGYIRSSIFSIYINKN